MLTRRYRTDPKLIEARLDELFYLHNAYERGYWAGVSMGIKVEAGRVSYEEGFRRPRSQFSRLIKHYEKQLKRLEKQR